MARLLNWPRGLHWTSREPVTGPRSVNAGSSEGVTGFVQSVASPFGLWRWKFAFPDLKGARFRRYRGLVTALNAGANAVRVDFCDPDGLTYADAGVIATRQKLNSGASWSNGQGWSNGLNWKTPRPTVPVISANVRGDTVISLAGTPGSIGTFAIGVSAIGVGPGPWGKWGYHLDMGDMIGFGPFYFGLHLVTEVIRPGTYRIWPPLRSGLSAGNFATLEPVMAMRLEGESGATAARGATHAENLTMTLVEVEDPDVRDFFAD